MNRNLTYLSIRYVTHPPCSIPAPFNMSAQKEKHPQNSGTQEKGEARTLRNRDLCDGHRLHAPCALPAMLDGHLDKARRAADGIAELVALADAVRVEDVAGKLLAVGGHVARDGGDVGGGVVGERGGVHPGLGGARFGGAGGGGGVVARGGHGGAREKWKGRTDRAKQVEFL